jgi:uncharacterized protein YqhQ
MAKKIKDATVEKVITSEIKVVPPVEEEPSNTVKSDAPLNIMALISFILSLAFFIPLNSIIAIILGHIALNDIKKNPNQDGEAFAKVALIISYIFVGIGFFLLFFFGGFILLAVIAAASLP